MMVKSREENYISLQEATRYCNYSQEYLSLRVRQGKIKAVKLGRNWVTKKEWIKEYVAQVDNYNHIVAKGVKKENVPARKIENIYASAQPPADLPVGQFSETVQSLYAPKKSQFSSAKFLFMFSVSCAILLVNIFMAKGFLGAALYDGSLAVQNSAVKVLGEKRIEVLNDYLLSAGKNYATVSEDFQTKISNNIFFSKFSRTFASVGSFAKNCFNFVGAQISFLREKTSPAVKNISDKITSVKISLFGDSKKSLADESTNNLEILQSANKGMVVVPSAGESDDALKAKIKSSFSDEVSVAPNSDETGVIVPVFKERKGDAYMYMLVPVKKK
jgi:hypothetical protein